MAKNLPFGFIYYPSLFPFRSGAGKEYTGTRNTVVYRLVSLRFILGCYIGSHAQIIFFFMVNTSFPLHGGYVWQYETRNNKKQ
jgi:hypothetical protein